MEVFVPEDRIETQPAHGYCLNKECANKDGSRFEFEIKNVPVTCPKCSACQEPTVGLLALTHFLTRDQRGPIVGEGGLRFRIVCSPTRDYLATGTNQEAASGDVSVVNCPGCLKGAMEQGLLKLSGHFLSRVVSKVKERLAQQDRS